MKQEEKMIDALLKEHARKGTSADEEFLEGVEKRLDQEESMQSSAGDRKSQTFKRWNWGLGIAAAVTVGVVGYYGWQQDKQDTLALNDEYHPAEQMAEADAIHTRTRTVRAKAPADTFKKESVSGEFRVTGGMRADSAEIVAGRKVDQVVAREMTSSDSALAAPASPVVQAESIQFADSAGRVGSVASNSPMPKQLSENRWKSKLSKKMPEHDSRMDGRVGNLGLDRTIERHPGNKYVLLTDNTFKSPWESPLSTFSVDVDTASYTNMRRMIQSGQSVPADAVRIEEMINYFDYAYPQPEGEHPFSVNVETASCPWNAEHRLVKVGLQGKDIIREKRPAANLVFLLDVSGSMNSQDKLPLLVESMKILLKELNGDDSVSIVVYAGAQGLALPPTHVDADGRETILKTLENMRSGGSTNGGSGITLAYNVAKKHFVKGGVNRVILGTDGDFNVGVTDNASLVSMVEREAKSGVFLSVLGFGQGNLNDSMLESITNKGNGNYSYIDNLREGRKVFLDDMMGTMVTIAKDVKIQVEFNPSKVKQYRLIGYANRMLKAEDFKNKRIDAGEIGAGHTVTALYEVVPGVAGEQPVVDDLKYQKNKQQPKPPKRELVDSPELMTVKLAYKQPEATKETESTYFNTPVTDSAKSWQQASEDFKFASSVSLFGMLQRQSQFTGSGDYTLVRKLAESGRGKDVKGLRTEFSDLVRKASE